MAIIDDVKESIWLRDLFGELVDKNDKTAVYYDSQNVIHLTKDQMHHERSSASRKNKTYRYLVPLLFER